MNRADPQRAPADAEDALLAAAVDEPARASFFPRLLPRPMVSSAVPLVSMAFGSSRVIAPSIAGFLIAAAGAPVTFLVCVAGVSTMIAVLTVLHPAREHPASHGSLLQNFTESLGYIRGNPVFANAIAAALLNAALAMGYVHMLPVFAKDLLHVDSRGLGILAAAAGIGALTGLVSFSWRQARVSPRNLMVGALTTYNVALIGLAFSEWYADVANADKSIGNSVGTPGTTPSTSLVLLQAQQKLNENAAVMNPRYATVNPAANAGLVEGMKGLFNPTDTISKQFKNGMMGNGVLGFDEINMSQSIKQHTTGTRAATGATTGAAVTTEGATTLTLTVGSGETIAVGDVFTIADVYAVNPQTRESTGSLFQFVALASSTSTTTATFGPMPGIRISSSG